jgi:hypothetical protein
MTPLVRTIARVGAMIAGALFFVGVFVVARSFGVQGYVLEVGGLALPVAILIIVYWDRKRKKKTE